MSERDGEPCALPELIVCATVYRETPPALLNRAEVAVGHLAVALFSRYMRHLLRLGRRTAPCGTPPQRHLL